MRESKKESKGKMPILASKQMNDKMLEMYATLKQMRTDVADVQQKRKPIEVMNGVKENALLLASLVDEYLAIDEKKQELMTPFDQWREEIKRDKEAAREKYLATPEELANVESLVDDIMKRKKEQEESAPKEDRDSE